MKAPPLRGWSEESSIIGRVIESWSIPGAEGQMIIGDTHRPSGEPRAAVVIAHGFKGYKDYGMFPRIARELAASGCIAHRFNFSHSGMTNDIATFARPDLFERDTWNKQVFDLVAVSDAITDGGLAGKGLPLFVIGHSRGGVTTLLTAGRFTYLKSIPDIGASQQRDGHPWALAGVITLAAPVTCNPLSEVDANRLLDEGWLESPSSRTGQRLRIGKAFLQEQIDDPASHDLLAHVARIRFPMLIVHGEADATVPPIDAERIVAASHGRASLHMIPHGDHVFNTPNPLRDDAPTSPQLQQVIDAAKRFMFDAIARGV